MFPSQQQARSVELHTNTKTIISPFLISVSVLMYHPRPLTTFQSRMPINPRGKHVCAVRVSEPLRWGGNLLTMELPAVAADEEENVARGARRAGRASVDADAGRAW